jgi:hypothetical protein
MKTVAAILKHKGYQVRTVEPTATIAQVVDVLAEHRIESGEARAIGGASVGSCSACGKQQRKHQSPAQRTHRPPAEPWRLR